MKYDELTHCFRCDARYDPTIKWAYGYYPKNDTTDKFYKTGTIKLGDCPICRKPPALTEEELYG